MSSVVVVVLAVVVVVGGLGGLYSEMYYYTNTYSNHPIRCWPLKADNNESKLLYCFEILFYSCAVWKPDILSVTEFRYLDREGIHRS